LTDQVTKLTGELAASETDIDELKSRCGDLEKKEEAHFAEMSALERKMLDIAQERDDTIIEKDEVVAQRNKVEQELINLKDYILSIYEEGFNQALDQVVLLYGVSANDNGFDIGKDVF